MKKIFCLILILIMVFSLAPNVFAAEILFRNIPWGSDYKTVIDSLTDIGFQWNEIQLGVGRLVGYHFNSYCYGDYQNACSVSGRGNLKVAGHTVNRITLQFAYKPDEKGTIDHNRERTYFYMATYTFDIENDIDKTDILNKMQGVYGDNYVKDNSDGCDDTIDFYTWQGNNNTVVELQINHTKNTVNLFYADKQGNTLINQAKELQEKVDLEALKEVGSDGL